MVLKIIAYKELSNRGFPCFVIHSIEGLIQLDAILDASVRKNIITVKDANTVVAYNNKGISYTIRVSEWISAENFPPIMEAVKQACARLAAIQKEIATRRAENADWSGAYTLEIDDDGRATEGQ